jgi:hypothetical protein
MSKTNERFLRHATPISRRASLGRVFNVTRESWRLADDPRIVRPQSLLLIGGHTASEAADLARSFAAAYPRHGFHKTSATWWGADDTYFHRFVVHAGRRGRGPAVLLASGLLGLLAVGAIRRRGGKAESRDAGPIP